MLLRNLRGVRLLQGKSSLGRMSSQGIIEEEALLPHKSRKSMDCNHVGPRLRVKYGQTPQSLGIWLNCLATGEALAWSSSMHASATITDSMACKQAQIDKLIEHSVDREEYLRRDREIRRAMERIATNYELRDVNATLRPIQESVSPHRR